MAERRDLRMRLGHLSDLIRTSPEYVVESSNAVQTRFRYLLDYAAERELDDNSTVWEDVHFRLGMLEEKAPWTAGGKSGLKCLRDVLEFYGYCNGIGREAEVRAWCDKIIVTVEK